MSNSVKETQFQGFAKALVAEITNVHDGLFDCSEWWKGNVQELIARRAYDLVCHSIRSQVQGMDLFCLNDPEWMRERVETIPDMTELPKEQK